MLEDYNIMELKFKKIYENAEIPSYATDGSVGLDLKAYYPITLVPGGMGIVNTGICVELPDSCEMTIRQRSGLSITYPNYIAIGIGTIDTDYRGELLIPVVNNNSFFNFVIKRGDRIAQAIISPIIKVSLIEVNELDNTKRGEGGFGHTGK
jgi:dUTP diphosphatase